MRVSAWGQIISGLFVSVFVGCGGGNGGYGSMTPAPTVSFSAPAAAATINFGQAVALTWTSSYATSCSATTSSAAGGAFTGTQMMSGSETAIPTAPGSYTYTLNCTGGGGTKSASATVGLITKEDLVVCNFNAGPTNTQGLGTTIIGLHPGTGSTPYYQPLFAKNALESVISRISRRAWRLSEACW